MTHPRWQYVLGSAFAAVIFYPVPDMWFIFWPAVIMCVMALLK